MPDLSLLPPSATIEGEDLRLGGCLVSDLAQRFGTSAYLIDEGALRARAREYLTALTSRHRRGRVCFAVKAYPSVSMIRVLVREGLGCDVVGAGELRLALAAGADPANIVMHGNAKSDEDIESAIAARIGYIVVDGFDDIDRIARLADERTPVLLRVVPGVESATHAALATGGSQSNLVVVPVTGAYCFTMANNYNAALRPPVIYCDNGTARVGVRRETFDDLLAREVGES